MVWKCSIVNCHWVFLYYQNEPCTYFNEVMRDEGVCASLHHSFGEVVAVDDFYARVGHEEESLNGPVQSPQLKMTNIHLKLLKCLVPWHSARNVTTLLQWRAVVKIFGKQWNPAPTWNWGIIIMILFSNQYTINEIQTIDVFNISAQVMWPVHFLLKPDFTM